MEELEEQSSPNLSIELVDVEIEDPLTHHQHQIQFESITNSKKSSPPQTFTSLSSMSSSSGPSSLKLQGERLTNRMNLGDEFMLNDSNPPIISNYEDTEIEDFPVNNAQPPDYAPKTMIQKTSTLKQKTTVTTKRQLTKGGARLTKMNSLSTQDLTQLNEATSTSSATTVMNARKYGSGGFARVRRDSHTNKENVKNKQKDIAVTIVTNKPPPQLSRSKTTLDFKTANQIRQQQQQSNRPVQRQGLQNATTQRDIKTTNHTTTTTINANSTNVNYNGVMGSNGSNFNRNVIHTPPSIRNSDLFTSLVGFLLFFFFRIFC